MKAQTRTQTVEKAQVKSLKPLKDKKKEALKYFVERLLSGQLKDHIAKIVLFGSVAKGTAKRDSDVDVLIFATKMLEEVSNVCAEAQMETYFEYSESVEPLIYPLEKLRIPGSYFLYRAINYGEEVYSMDEERLKMEEIKNYLQLAEEYLDGAKEALKARRFRIAIDAAYNAAELCAKGLILLKSDELPGSHGGIVGEFGKLYVKTGKVSKEAGRRLNKSLEVRNKARYEFSADISEEKAQEIIKLAEEIKTLLADKVE